MSKPDLLSLIDAEIATLKQARALVAATDKRKPGRPVKATAIAGAKPTKRRKMSTEARARIAAAQKARWAAQKKKAAR